MEIHSSSSVSEKAIIKNINSTGAMLSPLFDTPFEVGGCLNLADDEIDYDCVVHAFDC